MQDSQVNDVSDEETIHGQGRSARQDNVAFKDSAERCIPKGIKEPAENINWQTGCGTSNSKHCGRRRIRITRICLHNHDVHSQ